MVSIRALQESDDTRAFSSGDADLDRFLHRYAVRNQFVEHIGTPYLAVEGDLILGYATVAPANIRGEDFPQTRARKLPRYPLPALRLARLAVSLDGRGRGMGSRLLRYVFALALETARTLGCVGVLVDAKPGAVGFYEGVGFMRMDVVEGRGGGHPAPAPMFLHIEAIRAALKG